MAFKKILAAIDFSEITETVLGKAAELAKLTNATLIIMNVVEKEIPILISEGIVVPSIDLDTFEKLYEKLSEKAKEKLEGIAKDIEKNYKISPEIVVDVGEPFDLILEAAERKNVDLIVVGSHGKKGIERLLIGSVSEKIARKAKCSVLIVRKQKSEG